MRSTMESQSAAIRASELTKRFGDLTAVDHVSFEVRRGELFGLLGPNGAGKTTLSRMLTTLIVPTSGQGFVAGFDVARDPVRVREAIGVIPQALTSDLDLTGWENVDIYGGFYNLSRRVRRERAQHLIHMVGLTERANDLVQTYSGGMRRRLEIARGLVHSPEVLFLDEPTIGLDPQSRRAVWDLLEQLRRDTGLTISLTTHYMDEAETLCDRIAIVDGGKIIAIGSPAELKAMVKGSDRLELEVQGDAEKIARDAARTAGRPRSHARSRRPDCRSGRRRRPRDAEDYQRNRERRRQGFLDQARADVARGCLHPLHRTAPARRTGAQGRLLQLELRDADAAGTLKEEAGR